eukprot:326195-Rhodomonas_salina.2
MSNISCTVSNISCTVSNISCTINAPNSCTTNARPRGPDGVGGLAGCACAGGRGRVLACASGPPKQTRDPPRVPCASRIAAAPMLCTEWPWPPGCAEASLVCPGGRGRSLSPISVTSPRSQSRLPDLSH